MYIMDHIHNKNNKINCNTIDDYINSISIKCDNKIIYYKSTSKISNENLVIPTIENYREITKCNYNLNQLKKIAKHYKLKISGNKKELITRVVHFLYFSFFIIKIQKSFRGLIQRKYNLLHGPAFMKRNICNNPTDFITLEPIKDIEHNQFISYKDIDNFVYGFDIVSLYNLISKIKTMY